MSATATSRTTPAGVPATAFTRILEEGYGPGAWYGSDLRAAVADVTTASAFVRPARGRHNIAEIALHHAYWAAQITARLTGEPAAPFVLEGEDWFEVSDETRLSWLSITSALADAQQRLSQAVSQIGEGARTSPLSEAERFDLVVGITGHAAYHAGQIQLIKKLL